jgi:hypothetical protein
MLRDMAVETLLSLEEYLTTSYSPDREYRDGVLESELRTAAGVQLVVDKTLRIPDSPIVIPLLDVMEQ